MTRHDKTHDRTAAYVKTLSSQSRLTDSHRQALAAYVSIAHMPPAQGSATLAHIATQVPCAALHPSVRTASGVVAEATAMLKAKPAAV